jgi:hypothetical protein
LSSEAKGSLVFHSGCCGAQRLQAVEHEVKLDGQRLLAPERAVVVEGRDAFRHRHEIRRAWRRHPLDDGDDRLLGGTVVP